MTSDSEDVLVTRWSRLLEYAIFSYPIMLAVIFVGPLVLQSGVAGGTSYGRNPLAGTVAVLMVVGFLLTSVLMILVAVSLYFDAKAVSGTDVEWSPSPVLYAIGGFLFSGLVAFHYLYERHRHLGSSARSGNWWYAVVAYLGLAVLVAVLAVLPTSFDPVLTVAGLLGAVLPIALYLDAAYVSSSGGDWQPNPVNYYLVAFFGSILVVVPAILSGYYLFKRRRHLRTV